MDCLPIYIQRIIWYDYVDFDFEDLITPETQVSDYFNFRQIIPDEDKERDDFEVVKTVCGMNAREFVGALPDGWFESKIENNKETIIDHMIQKGSPMIAGMIMRKGITGYNSWMNRLKISLIEGHFEIVNVLYDCLKTYGGFDTDIVGVIEKVLLECKRPKIKKIKEWYKKIKRR